MISSLGYLRIESTDPGAWRDFGLKILGMTEGRGPEPNAVYLRMDEFPARLVVIPGSSDRLLASGWEVRDAQALAAVARALSDAGVPHKAGTDDELAARRVGAMLAADDPAGHHLEFFCGAALDSRPSVSPYGTRFVTGDLGLGHVVLPVPAGDEAAFGFYTDVLGFRLRDSMRMPAEFFGGKPGDPPVWFRFLGCNARHHSLALAPVPADPGIVHLMIETGSLDDVGRALDRCIRRGAPVSGSLGRHANDLMVSFYVRTPGGFDVEYGTHGRLVEDATWISRESTAVSLWGHSFAPQADLDADQFRQVLGHFCTGVTVITTSAPEGPAGFACQAFAALSLEPPLVLFCPSRASATWPLIERAGHFCANVLADGQQELARRFGMTGTDKFAGVTWSPSPSGPILDGALTWVGCAIEAVHEAGDHFLVTGRVTALGPGRAGRPLLFYRGRYGATDPGTGPTEVVDTLLAWPRHADWM